MPTVMRATAMRAMAVRAMAVRAMVVRAMVVRGVWCGHGRRVRVLLPETSRSPSLPRRS
jgi:hypothetical protein